ncbi:unnamed protein product [Rotaria sordida]|uniref:Uncharacterized protein n=1 Tax=Rotaria sordida TaxID=392033 RepID=A0A814J1U1_9BILA|nr:unnamed protein product [Rotaria sordida]
MASNGVILSFLVIIVLSCIDLSSSGWITLYQHRNYGGVMLVSRPVSNNDYKCFNLLDWMKDRGSSINTHGRCFVLFEHENCQGRSMKVTPDVNCRLNFEDCNFNDITSSFKIC